jgi:ketosteroid isomerase-like protein
MKSLLENQQTIMDQLEAGEFVQGMVDFYADDAINEEANGDQVIGKANIIANEHKILEQVAAFHGCTVHSIGANDDGKGNGTTFAEYELKVDMKDGSTFNPKQVQVTRWENGKAKHILFYYDPTKL